MKARNFIGDAFWSGEKNVELAIVHNQLIFTIDSKDQNLYITDFVTFTISQETKNIYKDFKLFVHFPKLPDELLEIQIGNQRQLLYTFYGLLTPEDMEKENTLKFELECKKIIMYGRTKSFSKEITILPHPGDTFIFTKII
jgi:hypothetical protein